MGNGYLINQVALDRALEEAGFIVEACRKGFIEKGYLIPGKSRDTKQRRIGGGNGVWCYEVIVPKMPEAGEADPWGEDTKTILFPGVQV